MKRVLAGLYFFLCIIIFSCKDKKTAGVVLEKEKMQAVMWDMLQADAFTQYFIKKDSTKNDLVENAALQKKIFELHKITKEDYTASYDYYSAHPEMMRVMMDSIAAKAQRENSKMMMERYSGSQPVKE